MTKSDNRPNHEITQLNAVSLFSGAGGLDLGLAAAGWNVLYESDIDDFSCSTLSNNKAEAARRGLLGFTDTIVERASALDLNGQEILDKVGLERGELDLMAGGPPCQAFSVFGRRQGMKDARGRLVEEYARLLAEMAPKAFVFENVYGLLSVHGGMVFESIKQLLANPGDDVEYNIEVQRVDAANYSVPQHRDRVIIIGRRIDIDSPIEFGQFVIEPNAYPPGTLSTSSAAKPWRSVNDAFNCLPDVGSSGAEALANHRGRKHGDEVKQRYEKLAFGERDSKTRINKLHPEKPSYTIVVGSDAGGGKGHVHPQFSRELTPRESARIQTFPDWWIFEGNVRHSIRQVGNAVPCLLGYAIGASVMEQIFDVTSIGFENALDLLDQKHLFEDVRSTALIA